MLYTVSNAKIVKIIVKKIRLPTRSLIFYC